MLAMANFTNKVMVNFNDDKLSYLMLVSILLFILLCIFLIPKSQLSPKPIPSYIPSLDGYLGMRCLNKCTDPAGVCVKNRQSDNFGYCFSGIGGRCDTFYDCVKDAKYCQGGICSLTLSGGLNQSPPCLLGYTQLDT